MSFREIKAELQAIRKAATKRALDSTDLVASAAENARDIALLAGIVERVLDTLQQVRKEVEEP
jgi:hypothetical protein